MSTHTSDFEHPRRLVGSATRPIEPPWRTLAALLLLAGKCLLPRLPCRARLSRSLSPFALSTGTQVPAEPQRSPLPAHTMTAHSGASNCGR